MGTGCKISVTENGTASAVATVVIKGDADGSGNITSTDYILVKRSFFGTYKLENFYLSASKVSGEETLNVMDYIMIKRAYFGTYKL